VPSNGKTKGRGAGWDEALKRLAWVMFEGGRKRRELTTPAPLQVAKKEEGREP